MQRAGLVAEGFSLVGIAARLGRGRLRLQVVGPLAECLVLGPDPLGQRAVARDAGLELGDIAGRKVGLRLRPLISG